MDKESKHALRLRAYGLWRKGLGCRSVAAACGTSLSWSKYWLRQFRLGRTPAPLPEKPGGGPAVPDPLEAALRDPGLPIGEPVASVARRHGVGYARLRYALHHGRADILEERTRRRTRTEENTD